jgi:putative ABC transport system substrate-binding protein
MSGSVPYQAPSFQETFVQYSFLRSRLSALALAVAATTPFAHATEKSVAVTAIVEHPALDAVRDGVRDELKSAGFEAGKNLKYEFQSAQGNTGTAAQIARKYAGDRPDVIVAIATPSAQAVVAAPRTSRWSTARSPTRSRPSWSRPGKPRAPTSPACPTASPLDKHLELIKRVVPNAKRVGVIYSPGEANSVLDHRGAEEGHAGRRHDAGGRRRGAHRRRGRRGAEPGRQGRRDLRPTDNNVMSAFEGIVKVAQQAKIPVVAATPTRFKRGAVAALGLSTSTSAARPAGGGAHHEGRKTAGTIASQVSDSFELHVNRRRAEAGHCAVATSCEVGQGGGQVSLMPRGHRSAPSGLTARTAFRGQA